jgi:hypothetical protein
LDEAEQRDSRMTGLQPLALARASGEEQVRVRNAPSFGLSTVSREPESTCDAHGPA